MFPITLDTLITGLIALDVALEVGIVVLALLVWRQFENSVYGRAFLILAAGWLSVLVHASREFQYSLGMLESFPTLSAAFFSTAGVAIMTYAFWTLYSDTR